MPDNKITYEIIIRRVREKLHCGSDRIADEPAYFHWSWWSNQPNFQDELLSNYGVDTNFKELQKKFYEEIQAIQETLDELGNKQDLADWQKVDIKEGRKMWDSLNQRGMALAIWNNIGVPIRRYADIVFRIWAPNDVLGTPIIKALPIDFFVNGVAEKTSSDRLEIERLKKTITKWQIAAIILSSIIALSVLVYVEKYFG